MIRSLAVLLHQTQGGRSINGGVKHALPEQAELRVAESPQGDSVRFRLILEKTDVARIIGRNGMTASAIRSLAKAAGEKHGIKVIVHMLSHEEAAEQP